MTQNRTIPERSEVPAEHTWDLSKLFQGDDEWEEGLQEFKSMISRIESFKGTLGESPERLKGCLDFMNGLGILEERLGYYAQLRMSENGGDSSHQAKMAKFVQASAEAETAASYQVPEIQAIPDTTMEDFLKSEILSDFVIYLKKILRYKPHVLTENEERLLAMQREANQTAGKSFQALTDVDMDFADLETPEGRRPLSQASFSSFLIDGRREIRERAYKQFYGVYEGHKNTLASLYSGSVHLDIYRARARNYPSARSAALFPDKMPETVYDNLLDAVHGKLDVLHQYYRLRKRVLGVKDLRHYDVYVPLVKDFKVEHTYEEAVEKVIDALEPLGEEYRNTLESGLLGRWVDRYENKGKRSGAFSAGSFAGDPYILMNFKEDVLRDVFTLAHEGGHSMHSYYSVRNNPFQHYDYTIFEAEVASTFNEQLLADYMMKRADSKEMETYLVGKQVDDIIATIFRQTMFAEYEHLVHRMAESGEPLTVDSLRKSYRNLLEAYFGADMSFEEVSDLEGLRIPHFYRAFYVYKYATGLAAAIALAKRVLAGGKEEREAYLSFLKSGGSRFPLESLQLAGVDMSRPGPVNEALDTFASLVERLEELLTE
jgi:oligoendopeptidase F